MQRHTTAGIFLRGLGMGAADIVPGVSGGTIAFITGIYDRFVEGIRDALDSPARMVRKRSLKPFLGLDWGLFLPLGVGIASAFALGSFFIPQLLEAYPALVYAFFVGLIVASTWVVYRRIPEHSAKGWLLGLVGVAAGLAVGFVAGQSQTPALWYVALSGFFAITAMLLPGISGSYILLVLGMYEHMLEAIRHAPDNLPTIGTFALGALLGVAALSHLLAYLLRAHRAPTLFFLAGLMIGALHRPLLAVLAGVTGAVTALSALALAAAGLAIVAALERYAA